VPLRLRLAGLFALATALAIAAAGLVFLHQLRDNLDDTLDSGLRARLASAVQELAADGQPLAFGPGEHLSQIRGLDGTILAATPDATALMLSPRRRERALTGPLVFTDEVAGIRTRILASTAPLGDSRVLVLVGARTDIADDAIERVRAAFLVMGPIAVLLAGVAAWVLAAAALRPVERMRQETASIGERDPERRLAVPATGDEIAALGATMNSLLDRLHHALERERRFVADASHELRTPLAILRAELELAARPGRSPHELGQAIAEAGQETQRLIRLAEDMLLLARADNHQPILRPARLRLGELLATAAGRGRARDHQPPVEIDCLGDLEVTVDPDRLLQAIDNLLDNAIRHSPSGTPVRLTAARDDDTLTIRVDDDGPGLPADLLPRAFERFQRAEQARSRDAGGTGLGLSIVRAIAEAHRGSARIANRAGGGARATIRLPAAAPNGSSDAARTPATDPRTGADRSGHTREGSL
jgi:heavy metal sensor kinase